MMIDKRIDSIKDEVIAEIRPLFEQYRKQLNEDIEFMNKDRKRQQRMIKTEIEELKTRLSHNQKGSNAENFDFVEKNLKFLGIRQTSQQVELTHIKGTITRMLEKSKHEQYLKMIEKEAKADEDPWKEQMNEKIAAIQEKIHNYQLKQSMAAITSKDINKFKIKDDGIIQMMEYDGLSHQLLGKIPIANKPINIFRIIESQYRYVSLGIINIKCSNDQQSQQQRQFISYDVWNGKIKINGKYITNQTGKGLKEGEQVWMSLQGDTLKWSVGSEKRAQVQSKDICDPSMTWVPFILMTHKGDQIEWK